MFSKIKEDFKMSFKTITGRRNDLEGIEVNPVIGYIGDQIYPTLSVMEKTGSIYYKTLTADDDVETGRVAGAAPSRTLLTDSVDTFSASEYIKRYGVVKAEVSQMGGIEQADRLGGTASKRSVQRAIEAAQIAKLFAGSATDISAAIIAGIQTGADSVRRYAGTTAFVCSQSVYRWIVAQTEITGKLAWTFGTNGVLAEDSLSMKTEMFKNFLQQIVAIDKVLIFDDDHEVAGKGDYAAIVKLPDPAEFSHKLDPVLGKTALYLPDGLQQYEIESFYDEDEKVNNYDCTSWLDIKELNVDAKYLVDGLDTAS